MTVLEDLFSNVSEISLLPPADPSAANDNDLTVASLYGRNSAPSKARSKFSTPKQQLEVAHAYAVSMNLDPRYSYTDDDISGRSVNGRRGFKRMLADAEAGRFKVLVLTDPTRFGRHAPSAIKAVDRLYDLGIVIYIVGVGPLTRENAMSALVQAQASLGHLHFSTRMGLRSRSALGLYMGEPPFVYRQDPDNPGKLQVIESEAEVIRGVIREILERGTARGIAKELNARGYKTRDESGWNHTNLIGGGHRWGLLRNPILAGVIVYGRTKTSFDHETGKKLQQPTPRDTWTISEAPEAAIICRETFKRLQKCLGYKKLDFTRGPSTVLSGLIRCSACRSHMTSVGKYADGHIVIHCHANDNKEGCTVSSRVSRTAIEDRIFSRIRSLLSDPKLQAEAETAYREQREKRSELYVLDRQKAKADLAAADTQIANVMAVARTMGSLPGRWSAASLKAIEADRLDAERRLEQSNYEFEMLERETSPVDKVRAGIGDVRGLVSGKCARLPQEARHAVRSLIDTIEVSTEGKRQIVEVRGFIEMRFDLPCRERGRPKRSAA